MLERLSTIAFILIYFAYSLILFAKIFALEFCRGARDLVLVTSGFLSAFSVLRLFDIQLESPPLALIQSSIKQAIDAAAALIARGAGSSLSDDAKAICSVLLVIAFMIMRGWRRSAPSVFKLGRDGYRRVEAKAKADRGLGPHDETPSMAETGDYLFYLISGGLLTVMALAVLVGVFLPDLARLIETKIGGNEFIWLICATLYYPRVFIWLAASTWFLYFLDNIYLTAIM